MFSIIVCSIKPSQAATLEQNIASTIGLPFEFIAFDNRGTGKGICAVYNECAQRAKYDLLCFIHEDVAFHTKGWGHILADKLSEPDCGVIGFAGGATKFPYPYGWCSLHEFSRMNYIQNIGNGKPPIITQSKCKDDFSKVVTLDGLCQFVRRDVWERCRYDEATFPLFHSYDTDFSTSVFVSGQTNYVCNRVLIEHFSLGNFDRIWLESEKVYLKKWGAHLPLFAEKSCAEQDKRKDVYVADYILRRQCKDGKLPSIEALRVLRDMIRKHPLHPRTLIMPFRILKYKIMHKKYEKMYPRKGSNSKRQSVKK